MVTDTNYVKFKVRTTSITTIGYVNFNSNQRHNFWTWNVGVVVRRSFFIPLLPKLFSVFEPLFSNLINL